MRRHLRLAVSPLIAGAALLVVTVSRLSGVSRICSGRFRTPRRARTTDKEGARHKTLVRLMRLLPVAATLMALMALPSQATAATTWYVDGTLGNDTNSCMAPGPGNACLTIQKAINLASSTDTIIVAAGAYPEPAPGPLTVNKTLTLLGAQSGVDARTRVGAESIVTDSQGTSVAANNVVIDGFTFENSTNAAFTGYGIWMNPGKTGTQILNNIIQDNIVGIGLGGSDVLIRHNLIRNNTQPGGASGSGIYTDEFVGGATVSNVLVQENAFTGHAGFGGAINISNTASGGGVFNLDVDTNSFNTNSRAFVLFNTHDSTIHDNTSTNSTFVGSADIRIFDNNTNLSILNNDLSNGAGHAIRLSFLGAVGGPSSGVVINENNIGTVGPASFVLDGLLVDTGSHDGTVNAECNWWGSPTGPTNTGNPGGTGEEVVGDADFTPWLVSPAPSGACVGGLPPTPGKVTGGGQIDDPIFSPLGDLLSLPALIPSLSDPSAQSTFGFVVKCCPATGNLEYNDHQMSVRIKATSISNLFITNGPCGTNTHATFTGKAAVTRPTGTSNQDFTVDVDDCGEPGTNDTFRIQTFGTPPYTSGPPQPLIGGNIQIHK